MYAIIACVGCVGHDAVLSTNPVTGHLGIYDGF
jgi:hypothetical protein